MRSHFSGPDIDYRLSCGLGSGAAGSNDKKLRNEALRL